MSRDTFKAKGDTIVDLDYFEEIETKSQAWDMLATSLSLGLPEDDTQYAYELRGKMNLLLKIAQEKEEDM